MKSSVRHHFLLLGLCFLTGCAAKQRVSPLSSIYLEDANLSQQIKTLPFDHSAVTADAAKSRFTSVYFEPIRIDLLPAEDWARSSSSVISSKADFDREARALAEYFRTELEGRMREEGKGKYSVASKSGPGVLDVKIVFTELEFSHPGARAASLVAPIPGTGAMVSSISDPHVSFAARLSDGGSGKLIATAADRKFAPTRILDLNKLTATSSAREICSLWAASISEAIASGGVTEIKEKKFDWKPW